MIEKLKLSKFWKLSLGLLLWGIGQRLMYTGGLAPWAKDRALPILLIVISLVAFLFALVLILPVAIWFYRRHQFDKRLLKLILLYLLAAILSGIIIGGVGQLLYDHTSFAYQDVRLGVWGISTIIQSILKLILYFGLVSIHKQLPIRKRRSILWLPLTGVVVINICLLLIHYWLPTVGSIVASLADASVLIASLYYFIYLEKEMTHETNS